MLSHTNTTATTVTTTTTTTMGQIQLAEQATHQVDSLIRCAGQVFASVHALKAPPIGDAAAPSGDDEQTAATIATTAAAATTTSTSTPATTSATATTATTSTDKEQDTMQDFLEKKNDYLVHVQQLNGTLVELSRLLEKVRVFMVGGWMGGWSPPRRLVTPSGHLFLTHFPRHHVATAR